MRADPLSCPDIIAHHRRHPGTHRHRMPLQRSSIMAGHLPDPRTAPEPMPSMAPTIFWGCCIAALMVGLAFICAVS